MKVYKYSTQLGYAPSTSKVRKPTFTLQKHLTLPLGLANAEEQTCELFICRDKGAKRGLKKKKKIKKTPNKQKTQTYKRTLRSSSLSLSRRCSLFLLHSYCFMEVLAENKWNEERGAMNCFS